jgi:hypothetical protein
MKLQPIDKALYRKRSNLIMMALVATLALSSLAYGAILIAFFGQPSIEGVESTGNFHWNLLGVIGGMISCALIINSLKQHEFFEQAYYVWRLKQLQNQIYRKLKKIQAGAKAENTEAIITLVFYYKSLRQVYLLDDNTLTLSKLDADIAKLEAHMASLGLTLEADEFEPQMLKGF